MHTALTGNPQDNRLKCTSENFSFSQLFGVVKYIIAAVNERQ